MYIKHTEIDTLVGRKTTDRQMIFSMQLPPHGRIMHTIEAKDYLREAQCFRR